MNKLTLCPVQPLLLCHMPKGDRPIDVAIWYFSDANNDIWAAPTLLGRGMVCRTFTNRRDAIFAVGVHGFSYRTFGVTKP